METPAHLSLVPGSGDRPGNGYMFTCPTVQRDTAFAICAKRRTMHWRGERSQAHDCHTAMRGGKCPAVHMLQLEMRTGEEMFFDREVKMHRLPKEILDRIQPIALLPSHAAGLTLTPEQQVTLFGEPREIPKVADPASAPEPKTRRAKKAAASEVDATAGLDNVVTDMASLVNKSIESGV